MTALDKLVASQPELRPAATLLRALIEGMTAVEVVLPPGLPNVDAVRARLGGGVHALEGEPLLDPALLARAVHSLAGHLGNAESNVPVAAAASALEEVLHGPDGALFAQGALIGAWEEIGEALASGMRDGDEHTMITLLDHATRPTLRVAAQRTREIIVAAHWTRGCCPACGAPPMLAELRAPTSGSERERFLRCGRCDAAWAHPRVRCPGCGTTDHRLLRYLHVEGEEEFRRVMSCDACQGYVKEVAVLDPLSWSELLEQDLATVGLDLMAIERGLHRAVIPT